MNVFGKGPSDLKVIVSDVDGTVYPPESPFLTERTRREYAALAARLGTTPEAISTRISQIRGEVSQREQRRCSVSEVVFALDISSEEWNQIRIETLPDPSRYFGANADIRSGLVKLLDKGIVVIWTTNSPAEVAKRILGVVIGSELLQRTQIVGQARGIAKPDSRYFQELVFPLITELGLKTDNALSIGDREDDDVRAALAAGIPGAIRIAGPSELGQVLELLSEQWPLTGGVHAESQPA